MWGTCLLLFCQLQTEGNYFYAIVGPPALVLRDPTLLLLYRVLCWCKMEQSFSYQPVSWHCSLFHKSLNKGL